MYVCMYVCIHVFVYMHMYIYIYVYTEPSYVHEYSNIVPSHSFHGSHETASAPRGWETTPTPDISGRPERSGYSATMTFKLNKGR